MKKNIHGEEPLNSIVHIPVLDLIAKSSGSLSAQQMVLARFILQNPDTAPFLNSVRLSEAAGVSNATVIRLAARLGFNGFPEFQKALQKTVLEQIRSLERYTTEQDDREESLSQRVLSLEFHVLGEMKRSLDESSLREAVDLLSLKRRIYVIGFLANTCLAEYFAYFLGILRENVNLIGHSGKNVFSQVQNAGKDDGAIIYSFPRYPAATQSLALYLKERGVPVVGVTDSPLSPLAACSDILLKAPMKFLSFIDPCAGAFALNHCLLTEFYYKNPGKMRDRLRAFEEYSQNQNLFLREDIDIVDL